jgi:hypothetical protein
MRVNDEPGQSSWSLLRMSGIQKTKYNICLNIVSFLSENRNEDLPSMKQYRQTLQSLIT